MEFPYIMQNTEPSPAGPLKISDVPLTHWSPLIAGDS